MRLHRNLSRGACAIIGTIALTVAVGCLPATSAASAAQDDAAIAAYLDAWNGDPSRLDSVLARDFLDSTTLLPLDAPMFKAQIRLWREAIPDLKVTLVERHDGADSAMLRLRLEGRPKDSAALVPLSGGSVLIEQTERLGMRAGTIASRAAAIDEWTLPLEWMFVAPPSAPFEPHLVQDVAAFGRGGFLESIAVARDGSLFVSTGIDGAIAMIDTRRKVTPFAKLDVGPGGFMMCLAFDPQGVLFATVNSRNPAILGLWRFDQAGNGTRVGALPPGAVPNGLAFDGRGNVLIADSFGGVIWRLPATGGEPQVWLRHPWLTPRPLVGRYPGANGLQRAGQSVIVAVSDRSLLLRVPIGAEGVAGAPEIVSANIPADDFAVAPDGTLYITTHPFNTVVRLDRNNRQTVIAGPAQGVIGPTSAAIGRDGWLYLATDGGLYRPMPGIAPRASVVRINVAPHAQR